MSDQLMPVLLNEPISFQLIFDVDLTSLVSRDVLHLTNGAFSERWFDIGKSLGKGSDQITAPWGEIVDPEIDHGFALHDGIFVPGLHPFGAPLGSCPTDHATLGHDSGVQIHFHKGTIAIGDESGNAFIARADKDDDNWTKLKTAIQSWTPVANDGGAALKTILMALITGPPAWPASVAATQGKVK